MDYIKDLFIVTLSVSEGFKIIEALSRMEDLYRMYMNDEHALKWQREELQEELYVNRWLQNLFSKKMRETGTYDY